VTSIALLLLGTWLIASLLMLPSLDRQTVLEWLRAPTGAVPMALLIVTGFRHALDGMKVVVDDYVHEEGNRFALNTLLLFLPNLDRQTVVEWLRAPTGAVPMALLIIVGFRHALDGMKVVVDYYVHEEGSRFGWNTLFLFLAVGGGALALYALGEIVFGAVA
jgi:succinate dehydrogenase hydrophobic membrane anchor protein